MKDEAAEAVIDLKTVYGEIHPHANPDKARFTAEHVTLAVLFRRELALFEKRMKWRNTPDTEA